MGPVYAGPASRRSQCSTDNPEAARLSLLPPLRDRKPAAVAAGFAHLQTRRPWSVHDGTVRAPTGWGLRARLEAVGSSAFWPCMSVEDFPPSLTRYGGDADIVDFGATEIRQQARALRPRAAEAR